MDISGKLLWERSQAPGLLLPLINPNTNTNIIFQILNPIPGVTDENRTAIGSVTLNSLENEDFSDEKVDEVHFIGTNTTY